MNKLFGPDMVNYNGQIRKYTALFGALFSDLHIRRGDDNLVAVPIKYGPGFLRNKGGNRLSDDFIRTGIVLPAMAFELVDISPDPQRRISPYIRQTNSDLVDKSNFTRFTSLAPSPHDFSYSLTIRSKTIEESFQIFEQIVSAFTPQVSVQLIDSKDLGVDRDITIKLEQGYQLSDNYEASQEDVRFVEINLNFTVKGFIYKRAVETPIVLEVSVNGKIDDDVFEFINVKATQEQLTELTNKKILSDVEKSISNI